MNGRTESVIFGRDWILFYERMCVKIEVQNELYKIIIYIYMYIYEDEVLYFQHVTAGKHFQYTGITTSCNTSNFVICLSEVQNELYNNNYLYIHDCLCSGSSGSVRHDQLSTGTPTLSVTTRAANSKRDTESHTGMYQL